MKIFKPTIISTMIGMALTTVATASSSVGIDLNHQVRPVIKHQNAKQQAQTVSGLKSQYDSQLGKTTFQWASKGHSLPDLSAVPVEKQLAFAADYYLNSVVGYSSAKTTGLQPVINNIHDTGRGAKIAKFNLQYQGVPVFNQEMNILMDSELNLIASSGYFVGQNVSSKPDLTLLQFGESTTAIGNAYAAMGGDSSKIDLTKKQDIQNYQHFNVVNKSNTKQLVGTPRAKKVYFEQKGKLIPAYYVEVETADADSLESDYKSFVVDAKNNKILFTHDLQQQAEPFDYRVYADVNGKPWDGPHGNVIPADGPDQVDATAYLAAPLISLTNGPISTNDAWLTDDAQVTAGNNVTAYVDAIAPDGFTNGDYMAGVTTPRTFDYRYNTSQTENSVNNRKAAIVNLFYMNNYLHDDFYDHGFDEASGNAQNLNYDRGGVEGDAIRAEVQDNSGTNNANMSTPADGASPRMQMYLWDSKDAVNGEAYGLTVTSSELGLLTSTQRSSFGPGQFSDITGKLVRIDDATNVVTDGCEPAANGADIAGNIAIIDRGACGFTQKVLLAQNAGAIAVIIANNSGTTAPAPMGGSDPAVIIPNFGISFNEGAALYAEMGTGDVTVSMFNKKPYKGSSWDNAIVSHEWGHYISNRLVGNSSGLINNQGRSMGEGWGDFHALLTLSESDDALIAGNEMFQKPYAAVSYVASFFNGIRRYPYSTNTEINPHTFASIGISAQVHASGEIWATMLWDSFVALINDERHSFDEAKSLMKDYLVAGYKMTPIAPTFTEARDAILAAAYANDVADYNVILAAFAARGMGAGAVSPSRYSTNHAGVIESYETVASMFDVVDMQVDSNYAGPTSGYCTNDGFLDKGETGTFSFTLTNKGTVALESLSAKVEVVGTQDVTFANDGVITLGPVGLFGSMSSTPLEFTLNDAETADNLELRLTFPDLDPEIQADSEFLVNTLVNLDFTPRAPVGQMTTSNMETASFVNDWRENVMTGGDFANGTVSTDSGGNVPFFASFGFDLGTTTMFINNNGFESDVAAETTEFTVGYGGSFEVSFWHFYGLETDWDGGVVEISVNDGSWVDVTAMGGVFSVGYNSDALIGGPSQALENRPVFTGRNPWGNMESINFGTGLNGNTVKLRFRIGSDSNSNDLGWWIDNVTFKNVTTAVFSDVIAGDTGSCENRAPVVASQEISLAEDSQLGVTLTGTDGNMDSVTYSIVTQPTNGALTGTAPDLTYTPNANFAGSDSFTFKSNDGIADSNVATVSITVTPVNDAPTLTAGANASVKEGESVTLTVTGVDIEDDSLTYTWTQTSGTDAGASSTSNSLSFTAPKISSDEVATFSVTASDGTSTSNTVSVSVDVKNKSGGGSFGWLLIMLASAVGFRRRQ